MSKCLANRCTRHCQRKQSNSKYLTNMLDGLTQRAAIFLYLGAFGIRRTQYLKALEHYDHYLYHGQSSKNIHRADSKFETNEPHYSKQVLINVFLLHCHAAFFNKLFTTVLKYQCKSFPLYFR